MTLQRLNSHFELVEQYLNAEYMLLRLRDAAGLKAQAITGMPHGTGVSDKVGDTAVEIVRAEEKLAALYTQLKEDEAPIIAWIETVPDICTQTALRLRFIHGKQWKEVSGLIGSTDDAVKRLCYSVVSQKEK